jgi:hypothetical protein
MQYRRSQRMTNHNAPQLSRMDLANHCTTFPGLSLLNTRAVKNCGACIEWNYNAVGGDNCLEGLVFTL